MLEYRSRLDRQEHLLDKDLTQDTDDLLADLDAAREERERQVHTTQNHHGGFVKNPFVKRPYHLATRALLAPSLSHHSDRQRPDVLAIK